LALQVQEVLRKDPLSGYLFVFRGRRSDLVKVIWHDGQGACLFTKRLERGRFIWPSVASEAVTISDLRRAQPADHIRRQCEASAAWIRRCGTVRLWRASLPLDPASA